MSKHKYHAVRTELDGYTFDSKKEARRYADLVLMLKAEEISKLEIKPVFDITVNGKHVCNYIADFRYVNKAGRVIVEDVKGMRTPVYKLKKKLLECYGIFISEV